MQLFCGAVFALIALASAAKLPSYMRVCHRNDPDLNTCLKTTLQDAVVKAAKGIPELNYPVTEPYHVPELLIEYQQRNDKAKITVTNSNVYGGTNVRLNDVRAQLNDTNGYVEFDVTFPKMFVEGNYKNEGTVYLTELKGKGIYNISMSDITDTWKVTGETITKGGETYMKILHFRMRPKIGKMKVYASNLFPGNEELTKASLTLANQFWEAFYYELLPFVQDSWDELATSILNQVSLKVPYNKLVLVD